MTLLASFLKKRNVSDYCASTYHDVFDLISTYHYVIYGGDDDGGHQGSDFRIIGVLLNYMTYKNLVYYLIALEKKLDVTL